MPNFTQTLCFIMGFTYFIYRMLGFKSSEELMSELNSGKRSEISALEIKKARLLHQASIPKGTILPQLGEVYQSVEPFQITYLTHHFAPFTGGEKTTFPKGEKIIVRQDVDSKAGSVYCIPLEYERMEKMLISKEELEEPTYSDYSLSIEHVQFEQHLKHIPTEPINYQIGDATNPIANGNKVIVHVCNDVGGWGKGFVVALSKKWKEPEQEYRKWFKSKENFELGKVQFVQVEEDLWIANMIAQRDTKPSPEGIPPIREVYVHQCLEQVREFAQNNNCSIHMPRIGCGLAGGKWENIEPLIKISLNAFGISTTVYDLK